MHHRITEQRVTFSRGQYIALNNSDDIARLDQIFTHETATGVRLFVRVTKTMPHARRLDPVTILPLRTLRQGDNSIQVYGLLAISSRRLYVLPIAISAAGVCTMDENGFTGDLLHVDWDIEYL